METCSSCVPILMTLVFFGGFLLMRRCIIARWERTTLEDKIHWFKSSGQSQHFLLTPVLRSRGGWRPMCAARTDGGAATAKSRARDADHACAPPGSRTQRCPRPRRRHATRRIPAGQDSSEESGHRSAHGRVVSRPDACTAY